MGTNSTNDSGIDTSIGILLAGLGIIAFVLLTVAGMANVRRSAERATSDAETGTPVVIDLGG